MGCEMAPNGKISTLFDQEFFPRDCEFMVFAS